MNFKKKRYLLVSLAGPISNFFLAILVVIILKSNIVRNYLLTQMLDITLWYNIMLGIFNLLPFPPLDGSKIVASLLPDRIEYFFYRYERYFYIILILMIYTNMIDRILSPMIYLVLNILLAI